MSFKPGLQTSAQVTGSIEELTTSEPAATNLIGLSIPVDGAAELVHPPMTSATMITQVIRSVVGVQGLLMSDDVSTMNAAAGGIAERVRAMFAPGCDTAFHSNDNAERDALTANTASA